MRSTLFIAALLLAAPANAEPQLLWEITHSGGTTLLSNTEALDMTFETNNGFLGGSYLPGSEGQTSTANQEQLTQFAADLISPSGHIFIRTAHCCAEFGDVDWFWDGVGASLTVATYVPRFGPGLWGYDITEITQTINQLDWEHSIDGWYADAQQTILIYGNLRGDFNGDGSVDAADYVFWRDSGQTQSLDDWTVLFGNRIDAANPLTGDFSGNGRVDAADYVAWRDNPTEFGGEQGYSNWRANFGKTTASTLAIASAPEPSSLMLLAIAACAVLSTRRR
jgi:hypothetical protein